MKLMALQDEAKTSWRVMLSTYREKTRVLVMIEGGCIEQYTYLRSHGQELLRSNQET